MGDCGLSTEVLEGIRNVAIGMQRAIIPRFGQSPKQAWDAVRRTSLDTYVEKVQGKIKKADVIASLRAEPPAPPFLTTRIDWIKDWLQRETTTDEEVQDFVEWATGTPGVPAGGIHFQGVGFHHSPLPFVHTCSCTVDITDPWNVPPIKRAEYNTPGGFIGFIKEAMANKTYTDG